MVNEVTVVGSRCGPFPDALRALAARNDSADKIDISALVSKRFPLGDGLAALEAADDVRNLKVILDVAQ